MKTNELIKLLKKTKRCHLLRHGKRHDKKMQDWSKEVRMAIYVYPAIFTPEENGQYSVVFPDIEGCYTSGDSLSDAIFMAEDALALMLYHYEAEGKDIPPMSSHHDLSDGEFINFICCDTLEYQKIHNNKAVKKTLTIPEWLNERAERAGINFSGVLQEALKEKLGLI